MSKILDIINELAAKSYGPTSVVNLPLDEAAKKIPTETAANYATIHIVHAITLFAKAWLGNIGRSIYSETANRKRPGYAEKLENAKVGDRYWYGDLEDGFGQKIVVGRDEDGYALLCRISGSLANFVDWANNEDHPTLADLIAAKAEEEIGYHGGRHTFALKAKEAVKNGMPLDEFTEGYPDDE